MIQRVLRFSAGRSVSVLLPPATAVDPPSVIAARSQQPTTSRVLPPQRRWRTTWAGACWHRHCYWTDRQQQARRIRCCPLLPIAAIICWSRRAPPISDPPHLSPRMRSCENGRERRGHEPRQTRPSLPQQQHPVIQSPSLEERKNKRLAVSTRGTLASCPMSFALSDALSTLDLVPSLMSSACAAARQQKGAGRMQAGASVLPLA